ncbi:hypothetical protein [Geomicrobium sp. JCM 19039]|uniref:hypothetical protein n=1 Tax=Geomicrobium sp. JCM 19039 TaxID=1460636 RepID=UPI0005A77835|nr:hypothetical protein [Geomicrobium sp. JCM 19039]
MDHQNINRSLSVSRDLTLGKPKLTPGQWFSGRITKIYRGRQAVVHTSGGSMVARLEAPLTANERYLFQVQSVKGEVHLKVFPTPSNSPSKDQLSATGLGNNRQERALLGRFLRDETPFTTNALQQGGELLKAIGRKDAHAVKIVGAMIQQLLPLTPSVYQAIDAFTRGDQGASASLRKLQSSTTMQAATPSSNQFLQLLTTLLERSTVSANQAVTTSRLEQLLQEATGREVPHHREKGQECC